jgi:putative ABC transport system permease protein
MITQNATAFVIPLPMSYAQRLKAVPHVQDVTWANWFGGKYGDGKDFFAQFAIDPESYLKMYPELAVPEDQKQAFFKERSSAIIGEGLVRKFGWKIGDNVTMQGTIFPGDWTFTIRGIYHPTLKEYGDDSFMFHYDYLYEREPTRVTPGWFIMKIEIVRKLKYQKCAVSCSFTPSTIELQCCSANVLSTTMSPVRDTLPMSVTVELSHPM